MDSVIDQIKQKLDVVEVVGEYLKLSKAGRNFKARCPFHGERDASFMVSPERQIWHCFGCGQGGDIFGFVMKMEGLEFADALRLLARRAGVVLRKQDAGVQSRKKDLYDICELAAKFFETQLHKTSAGGKALAYLKERGLNDETIKNWRLGWAHNDWRALSEFLKSRSHKDEEIAQAGLSIKKEASDGYYDRFRGRIIFPIFDIQGQIIAFGGRIFGNQQNDDAAKYLNSPQTPLYDKSNVLYGLHQAKLEVRRRDLCLMVEGYMDLIMSHQAGIQNAVASSGTALTDNHLQIIGRYTKNLAMAFDSDEAGGLATGRSLDLALAQNLNVKVILMSDKDPADVIKKNPEEWRLVVENAKSAMDFYFYRAFAKFSDKNVEGKKAIREALLPVIKLLSSRTEQSEWLKELARRLRADEKDLLADMKMIKTASAGEYESKKQSVGYSMVSSSASRQEGLEERFLSLCLICPECLAGLDITEEIFVSAPLGKIFGELKKNIGQNEDKNNNAIERRLVESLTPDLKMLVSRLFLLADEQPMDKKDIFLEISTCLKELKLLRLRQRLTALSFDIREAQAEGDKIILDELSKNFNQSAAELTKIIQADSAEKR